MIVAALDIVVWDWTVVEQLLPINLQAAARRGVRRKPTFNWCDLCEDPISVVRCNKLKILMLKIRNRSKRVPNTTQMEPKGNKRMPNDATVAPKSSLEAFEIPEHLVRVLRFYR